MLEDGRDRDARRALLEGAAHAGSALRAGMGVGHAMAQALGGRYGLAHGTMNAVCLPPALRFNLEVAAGRDRALRRGDGRRPDRAHRGAGRARRARKRLREYAVPHEDLPELAEATAVRPAAKGNPRPAPPERDPEAAREHLVAHQRRSRCHAS